MRLHYVRVLSREGLSEPRLVELPIADDEDRDASGLILSPGWMDLHAHLRDPGFPEKETLITGTASAAFGGFTHVVAMANTDPVTDTPQTLHALVARGESLPVRVSFVGAVTEGLEGKVLTDARSLKAAGAVALSDDGRHAMAIATFRAALEAAAAADLPVLVHAQKETLGTGPESEIAAVTEALEALKDVPSARLHIQHVSTRPAVDLIRAARDQNLPVTAEVTPHHLALTRDDVAAMGPFGNVNPRLRSDDDREALRDALAEGVIDVIATDHAPHELAAKAAGANGFHGFETALPIVMGLGLDPRVLYRATVEGPRVIMGAEGDSGDWILIDPELEWTVDPSSLRSRGKNTPFAGRRLRGHVVMTVCRGQVLFERMVQRV
ncbi:MAG TPA: dihydroorotase [Candidatus Dormibacteraeota bacterium]|nr:dihydroorotase [Candidatus Dormibacteraeota bacterium]